jgi:hypothetical protein
MLVGPPVAFGAQLTPGEIAARAEFAEQVCRVGGERGRECVVRRRATFVSTVHELSLPDDRCGPPQ